MKKLYFLLSIVLCLSSYNRLLAQCPDGRYYDKNFSSSVSTVQYGNAMQYDSTYINLDVDIYQPSGDSFARRPLMIFAFGGSFVSGVRQSPDLVYLCTAFSERGYVCASIDYRLGYYGSGTDTNLFQAMIRGIQDMKAAIRFFYKDAATVNKYHIDTNQIFVGGVSAGAFIALNEAYWSFTNYSKAPPGFVLPSIASLGGWDGNSGNPGYSEKVKGVIDLCGAIADTVWLTAGVPILVGVHGTADSTVACYYDSAYAIINDKSMLFGGGDIKNRLTHINTPQTTLIDSFYLFQGAGHCPFILPYPPTYNPVPWMDTTEDIIRDFLYPNIVCDEYPEAIATVPAGLSVSVSPVPSSDIVEVSSKEPKDLAISILTADGQLVQQEPLPANSTITLSKESLGAGVYLIEFSDKSNKKVLKTEKIIFY
jgi:para-nitrobenzyl esterase